MLHRVLDVVEAADVQEGFLLACERGVGEVFSGGGGADRHGDVGAAGVGHHLVPSFLDVGIQLGRERGVDDPLADFLAHPGQFADVVDIEFGQRGVDLVGQAIVLQEIPVCLSSGGKAAGNTNAGARQLTDHFAEEAFLPPTSSTSVMRSFSNQMT